MAIGHGINAKRFAQYASNEDYFIFGDGIEASNAVTAESLQQEEEALKTALLKNQNRLFVYFSTTSIYDQTLQNSIYVKHKLAMEVLIKAQCQRFIIFRISQIVGNSDNKSSLFNFLVNSIISGEKFKLWKNTTRNLIDIDDIFFIVDYILTNKLFTGKIINIANPNQYEIISLVNKIEVFFNKKANFEIVDQSSHYTIPVREIEPIIQELKLHFNDQYIENLLKKYFSYLINGPKKISIVIPTYYAEKGIDEFYHRTKKVLTQLSPRYEHEFIFVNDGSLDGTMAKLVTLHSLDNKVKIIDLSRNFGNQPAITAGVDKATGDAVVIIDDDLQDPPEIILSFVSKWEAGFNVVYGKRRKRKGTNFLFKLIAMLYYRVVDRLSDIEIPKDTGDFRLIDAKVCQSLRDMREEGRYYRGLVAWTGFNQIPIIYDRDPRYAGTTTFTFKKYLNFGFTGITSFSDRPLYFASYFGLFITIVGFFFACLIIILKILNPEVSIRGWTSLSVLVVFFGGIQLLSTGILGIYISKIFQQVKNRPLYIVKNEYGF